LQFAELAQVPAAAAIYGVAPNLDVKCNPGCLRKATPW